MASLFSYENNKDFHLTSIFTMQMFIRTISLREILLSLSDRGASGKAGYLSGG
jgi:hypothetical protein